MSVREGTAERSACLEFRLTPPFSLSLQSGASAVDGNDAASIKSLPFGKDKIAVRKEQWHAGIAARGKLPIMKPSLLLSFLLRRPALIVLLVLAFVTSSFNLLAANEPEPTLAPEITFVFDGRTFSNVKELQVAAKSELALKGISVPTNVVCQIVVRLKDTQPQCLVVFAEKADANEARMEYSVLFDKHGVSAFIQASKRKYLSPLDLTPQVKQEMIDYVTRTGEKVPEPKR